MKAYPQHYRQAVRDDNGGMDLRDFFAAAALTGMLAFGDTNNRSETYLSRKSYKIADAMLEHRKEPV